jgi:hypothetical protein
MLGKVIVGGSVGAVVVLMILLYTTTPATIGPLGLLLVFIMIYALVLGVLTFFVFGLSRLGTRVSSVLSLSRPLRPLSLKRAYYYCSVVALAPVMLLGMQSVGTIGVYEVILVVLFTIIACVYIAKRSEK